MKFYDLKNISIRWSRERSRIKYVFSPRAFRTNSDNTIFSSEDLLFINCIYLQLGEIACACYMYIKFDFVCNIKYIVLRYNCSDLCFYVRKRVKKITLTVHTRAWARYNIVHTMPDVLLLQPCKVMSEKCKFRWT